ncbi:PREDICTED: gibberellin-regulated protein 9 isoform X3 [Tarenaya hassleriana]|uniref:gibberellin-regulated protein 9 isoform X3 n=1 Tax=Tarenaya hassleriana TaxID=28532 RepID=UPI00053C8C67|nr:PREDICTED: gibberellin-regulated protein 9 isoform X3 [Tarenaya hassleriana]
MKMKKVDAVALVFVIFIMILQTNEEDQTAAFGRRTHRPTFKCGKACERRCRESSRKKVCYRACGTCCLRCGCVPPGTSGHTNTCPCYASLRTHANKPKCP